MPGNQYFRFPERKVRYSSRMRLRFWYMIAPGTEGEFKARIASAEAAGGAYEVAFLYAEDDSPNQASRPRPTDHTDNDHDEEKGIERADG